MENCLGAFPLPVLHGFHLHAALPVQIIQHAYFNDMNDMNLQQLVTSIAKLSLYQSLLSHVSKFSVPLHMWLSVSGPALQQLRSPETGWSWNPWGTVSHLCPVNETRLKTRDTLRNYVPKREPRKEDLVKKHLESCNWVVEKVRTSAIQHGLPAPLPLCTAPVPWNFVSASVVGQAMLPANTRCRQKDLQWELIMHFTHGMSHGELSAAKQCN